MTKSGKFSGTIKLLFLALVLGTGVRFAKASPGVSAYLCSRESLVDVLQDNGMAYDTASRRRMAEADPHAEMQRMLPYTKSAEQNKHLLADLCHASSYGYSQKKRHSREAFATDKSPKISWAQYYEIRQTIRDTARANGVDEEKALQLFGCESIGFNPLATNVSYIKLKDGSRLRTIDRGLGQINSYFHPEVTNAQAYNWRYSVGWVIREAKVEYVSRRTGKLIRQTSEWACWTSPNYLNYGTASIRSNTNTEFASNSE